MYLRYEYYFVDMLEDINLRIKSSKHLNVKIKAELSEKINLLIRKLNEKYLGDVGTSNDMGESEELKEQKEANAILVDRIKKLEKSKNILKSTNILLFSMLYVIILILVFLTYKNAGIANNTKWKMMFPTEYNLETSILVLTISAFLSLFMLFATERILKKRENK